jgi:hypothetical protein
MMNTTFFKKITIVLVALFFASCDKDYNTLGSDIVGNENFDFITATPTINVYNQKIPAVQTNNLSVNQLGIYNNPVFGKTKANFVTQLSLATLAPTFKSHPVIDSVVVSVPYFSTKGITDSSGKTDYTLNNIKGTGTINLQVFRNGLELLDYDPTTNFSTAKRYFSDQDGDFDGAKYGVVLNDDPRAEENSAFVFSKKEYVKYKVENLAIMPRIDANIESRNSPRMRLHLKTSYFQTEIIDKAANSTTAADFVNNNAFKAYFKGLYFQVQNASSGSMASLEFSKGDVTIYYKQDVINNDTSPVPVKEMASLSLNMTGNTVNLLDNTDDTINYTNGLIAPRTIVGQTRGQRNLYLRGGEGSMAFVELFAGTDGAAQLADLKAKNVLVNDASLTFTVDQSQSVMTGHTNPQRIYIYDADNNTPLYDYYFDSTTNSSDSKLNKYIHGGIFDESTGKMTYKVRITEHISNILKETTNLKNVRLGVVVIENINTVGYAFLKDKNTLAPSSSDLAKKIDRVPVSSVLNTGGTVFYGNDTTEDGVKFEIHYTKPN